MQQLTSERRTSPSDGLLVAIVVFLGLCSDAGSSGEFLQISLTCYLVAGLIAFVWGFVRCLFGRQRYLLNTPFISALVLGGVFAGVIVLLMALVDAGIDWVL